MKNILILSITMGLLLSGCTLSKQPAQNNNVNANVNTAPVSGQPNNTGQTPDKKPLANSLDLSNQGLSKIPDYVFKQTNLEELNVSNNQLTGAMQAEIRQLKNLKVLRANNNLMTGVPAEVGQLQNLQILDLSNNQLTGLPYELGNLKNLNTLNISGNNYSELDLGIIKEKLPTSTNIIK